MRPSVFSPTGTADRLPRVGDVHAALQAFRRTHGNRADHAVTQLLLNFERNVGVVDDQRIVNFGDLARRELNVHDSANYLHSSSSAHYLGPLTRSNGHAPFSKQNNPQLTGDRGRAADNL